MRILFDHNIPKRLRRFLSGHFVSTSRELGWDTLRNEELLETAEANAFEVMVTGDKNISYQQNLTSRQIALIVLDTTNWNVIRLHPNHVVVALEAAKPGSYQFVLLNR